MRACLLGAGVPAERSRSGTRGVAAVAAGAAEAPDPARFLVCEALAGAPARETGGAGTGASPAGVGDADADCSVTISSAPLPSGAAALEGATSAVAAERAGATSAARGRIKSMRIRPSESNRPKLCSAEDNAKTTHPVAIAISLQRARSSGRWIPETEGGGAGQEGLFISCEASSSRGSIFMCVILRNHERDCNIKLTYNSVKICAYTTQLVNRRRYSARSR